MRTPESSESSETIDWEEVRVRADAREWFAECISLIAWFWDDDGAVGCQPSLVVRHYETKQRYPRAVRRESPERLKELLRDEWLRAGKPPTGLPKLTAWQDCNGRTAWHIDLGGVPDDQRILVGRALIRRPTCGVWDTVKSEIAYVGAAKIRYFNSLGASILEPTDERIAEQFEEIDPESDAVNNFIILYRDGTSFIAYIVPEGMVTEVTPRDSVHGWRAGYPGDGLAVRKFKHLGVFREEEIIGHSMAMEILMRFLSDTSNLPEVSGLIWRKVEPDFACFHEEDFP
jgi:hypothetical protein